MRTIRKVLYLAAVPTVILFPVFWELGLAHRNLHVRNRVRQEWRAYWSFWRQIK